MSYPVNVEIDSVEKRSRLTTFFRLILAIPLFIVAYVYEIVLGIIVIIAWFALLFTGRWPQGLYDLTTGFLRWFTRVNAYVYLACDPYPPFGLEEKPDYPVRVNFAPPLDSYSRLLVLVRIFYIIPAVIVVYALVLVFELVAIAAWFVILVTGRQPEGIQSVMRFCITYVCRASALMTLVTEKYPPFSDEAQPPAAASSAPPPPPAMPE